MNGAAPDPVSKKAGVWQALRTSLAGIGASGTETVRDQQQRLNAAFAAPAGGASQPDAYPASRCLRPLLSALNWAGEERHLLEALPHFDSIRDPEALRAVLQRLGYKTFERSVSLKTLRPDQLPCLAFGKSGNVLVVIERQEDGTLLVFDGAADEFKNLKNGKRHVVCFVERSVAERDPIALKQANWFLTSLIKLRKPVFAVALISLVANLLALVTPIYVMSVYNSVIGSKSGATLAYFFLGIVLILGAELAFRRQRSRLVAYIGTRFDSELITNAFRQIITMPISMTETASIGAQISRFRQFEGFRDFFNGHIVNALLDMPFTIVFLGAILFIGGYLVFVPLALMAVFFVVAISVLPAVRQQVADAGRMRTKLQNLQIEVLQKRRSIREVGGEEIWRRRFEHLSRQSAEKKFRSQFTAMSLHTISQAIVTVAGVATLGFGALLAINGDMSIGALIASMIFIWRILSPIQVAFLSINKITQFAESIKQINQLMRFRTERMPGQVPSVLRTFSGNIALNGIGFRYLPTAEPVLKGVSLTVEAGEAIAIAGPSGSGKSTLLKLLLNLYQPQAGVISIDGLNVRQIDVGELRNAIGYVPQQNFFFYGSVAQNIRLAEPTATDAEIEDALLQVGIGPDHPLLERGLQSHLRLANRDALSEGFKQRLSIARALVKPAAIYLFDEPGTYLDRAGDETFIEKMRALKGRATVLIVTNRPSHMRVCDRVIYLRDGMIAANGTPDEIIPAITGQGGPQKGAMK